MKTILLMKFFMILCFVAVMCPQRTLASLSGTYTIGEFSNTLSRSPSSAVSTIVGGNSTSVVFDVQGTCSVISNWMQFEAGYASAKSTSYDRVVQTSGTNSPATCTYTVDSTGAAAITLDGSEVISGWQVSEDGKTLLRLGTYSNLTSGNGTNYTSQILVGVKVGSGMSETSLNGTYKIGELDNNFSKLTGSAVSDILGGNDITASFDGQGTCSVSSNWMQFEAGYASAQSTVYDRVALTSGTNSPATCTYTVDSTGAAAITLDGSEVISDWQVSEDGKTLLRLGTYSSLTSGNGTNYTSQILVGVKVGSGLSETSLSGTYKIGELDNSFSKSASSAVSNIFGGNNIIASFDGNGTCSVSSSWMQFESGYASAQPIGYDRVALTSGTNSPVTCTYTVDSTGAAAIALDGSEVISGWQVSEDGKTLLRLGTYSSLTSGNGTNYTSQILVGTKINWTINASPSSVNFGNVAVGSNAEPIQITITNSGPGPLTISSIAKTGDLSVINSHSGGTSACPNTMPFTLPVSGLCTLLATFTPTSVGSKLAEITINSNAINPVYSITLTGSGVTVPGAPTINSVTSWDGEATVNFTAPINDGGSSIQGYTVTTNPVVTPVSGAGPSIKITGLTNGLQYTISLAAYNEVGTGLVASSSVTPNFAPFRIGTTGYADMSAALAVVALNGEIKAQSGAVPLAYSPLTLTQGITISGGYPLDGYTSASGFTTILGRVNIRSTNGKVVFNNIKIE